jgi:hypothetical protein
MKRRNKVIATIGAVLAAGLGGYLLFGESDRTHGRFPELRPTTEAPAGYAWEFKDGPDFYTWVMAETELVGERHRSGIGIYFGLHPERSVFEGVTEETSGRAVSQRVTWSVTRSNETTNPWVQRNALLKYNHGREFCTITLHVWVWGQTDEQVTELMKLVEKLELVNRG